VATIQIHFQEGLTVRLPVSASVLHSMLELKPGMSGVSFRRNLKFVIVREDGRRTTMRTSRISLVSDAY